MCKLCTGKQVVDLDRVDYEGTFCTVLPMINEEKIRPGVRETRNVDRAVCGDGGGTTSKRDKGGGRASMLAARTAYDGETKS